ncbi:MAG: SPOR domain-containing protein [candidate division WOR-3 bacterium]
MSGATRIWCSLFLAIAIASASGDEIDEAIKLFNDFKFEEARKAFQEILKKESRDPRIPEVYFYLARLTPKPESAEVYYNIIITDYPDSRFSDKAYLELAKMYFAREDYTRAIMRLNELKEKFPESIVLDQVFFWLGLAYMGANDKRNGILLLKSLIETFPNSPWAARARSVLRSEKQPIEEKESAFTVQIGSYRNQVNAKNQLEKLKARGLDATISQFTVGRDTFYRIWVGEFNTLEQAKEYLRTLDSLGYKGNVVKK